MNQDHLRSDYADKQFEPVKRSKTFNRILDTLGLRTKKTLDIGCGWGQYLVNFGPGSIGITTTPEEVAYGKSRTIRIETGNAEQVDESPALQRERFDAIWANNLFEHLTAPHAFLIKLKVISGPSTTLVLGVPVVPKLVWLMRLRKFRGALAGGHVNFFTRDTLRLTVERTGWKIRAVRSFVTGNAFLDEHFFSHFMPHMYVVAENDPDFRYNGKKLAEWHADPLYQRLISITEHPAPGTR